MKPRRFAFTFVAAACLLVSIGSGFLAHKTPSVPRSIAHRSWTSEAHEVPALLRSLRPNYPYSVIPGGVYSSEELKQRLLRDAVARDHYAGFDLHSVRFVRAEEPRLMYASYRSHGTVYWTKRALHIPRGELLLTDGTHYARARCGNRLSAVPATPVDPQPVPMSELEQPSITDPGAPDAPGMFASAGDFVVPEFATVTIPAVSSPFSTGGPGSPRSGSFLRLESGTPAFFPSFGPYSAPKMTHNQLPPVPPGPPEGPVPPLGPPPPTVAPVPEPRSLTEFGLCLAGIVFVVSRWRKKASLRH